MAVLDPREGFQRWAACYDSGDNALRKLSDRAVREAVGEHPPGLILDAGCGTGSWLRAWPRAVGLDFSPAMLSRCPPDRVALADLAAPPVRPDSCDLIVACLTLSYLADPAAALRLLQRAARPSGRIVVVDLHPAAHQAGWRRTFEADGQTWEIRSRPDRLAEALAAGPGPGWAEQQREAVSFRWEDRAWFERPGAPEIGRVVSVPALLLTVWSRTAVF